MTSREEGDILTRMSDSPIPGKRQRGRRKPGGDSCSRDTKSVRLNVEDVIGRTKWNKEMQNYSGSPR